MGNLSSMWQRFKTWLGAPQLRSETPLSFEEQVARALAGPGNPENIQVDWSNAPADAIEWRFDERRQQGCWINGKNRVEEYGIVWEAYEAPSFGASQKASIKITPEGIAARDATRLQNNTVPAETLAHARRL